MQKGNKRKNGKNYNEKGRNKMQNGTEKYRDI